MPAVYVAFFAISSDPTQSATEDAQLRKDVLGIKTALAKSGFRSRCAVVLVGDRTIAQAPDLEDRIISLRRSAQLDAKNALFFV